MQSHQTSATLRAARQRATTDARQSPYPLARTVAHASRTGGAALDPVTRAWANSRFDHDFADVRVYSDPVSTEALGAAALTTGTSIVFAPGRYVSGTASGRRLLAHELAHVRQQRGLTGPPRSVGRPDGAAEREADLAADLIDTARPLPDIWHVPEAGTVQLHPGEACPAPPEWQPLTGAIKAPGTGFVVQRREESNAPLAEIQGLPMYDLLPRLAKLAEKVLSDEEAGGLVGGPRLVLAMQIVRAKMQRDLEFLLREKKRVETLPRDQIADIVNFLWGPNVGTSTALVNTDLEMDPIIAPPASVRLPGEAARAGDGGITVDDESGPQGISDFERNLPENRSRISGVVLDPETKEIIGYRTFHADGISRLVDREGNFVVDAGAAGGVESEGIGPLDYFPIPSGVGKGAAGVGAKLLAKGALKKGAVSGGKVTIGAILKMKNVAKAVAKKAISPIAEGKSFIQAIRSGQRVSRTLSVEAAETLAKKFDKGLPIIAAEMNKRGIVGPFDSFSVFTRGHGGAYQAHHIIEQSVLKHLGHDVQKAPSVILTAGQHSPISTALTKEIPKGELEHMTKKEILDLYRKVYNGMPEWIAEVERYLR